MSRYLHFGDGEGESLASNTGWGDVHDWVGKLPDGFAMNLRHLCAYGWAQNLDDLAAETEAALKLRTPKKHDVIATVENLIEMLKARPDGVASCTVSDGMEADDEETMNKRVRLQIAQAWRS